MRTLEITLHTIEDHPEPEKCYEWIRNNWHDLNEHSLHADRIGGKLDYSISTVPDRGEYITVSGYDPDALAELNHEELPLTGIYWDYEAILGLRENDPERVLRALHSDTEYIYSDEGLKEHCIANDYEFHENGEFNRYW